MLRRLGLRNTRHGFLKAPCTYTVYAYALKGLLYRYFKTAVYTRQVHGALGRKGVGVVVLGSHTAVMRYLRYPTFAGFRVLGSRVLD